jgi:phosphatidate cytidylyltransferase
MLKRTISGAVLLAVMIALVAAGGKILLAGLFLMSMIGLYEFYKAVREGGHRPFSIVGLVMCFLYYLVLLLWPDKLMESSLHQSLMIAFFLILMILTVTGYPGRRIEDTALSFAGFVYVAVFFACMYAVRNMQNGAYVVWYIFIASWGCDTCAYLAGRFFGKRKMVPELSPHKTIAGGIGGVVGAVVLSLIYTWIFAEHLPFTGAVLYLAAAAIGFFGGILSQFGDLFASSVKRVTGIKDFGNLIPGHGGILDRFDSTLLVTPAVLLLIRIVMRIQG